MKTLQGLMSKPADRLFYDPRFRRELEFHMDVIRRHPSTMTKLIDRDAAHKYEGDLYGFLEYAKVSANLHWLVMRVNEMAGPVDFGPSFHQLRIPDFELIRVIRDRYLTVQKKMA